MKIILNLLNEKKIQFLKQKLHIINLKTIRLPIATMQLTIIKP